MREDRLRREAIENLPQGYYVLGAADTLAPDDLLWSWTTKEWVRADSPHWRHNSIERGDRVEDVICAIRRAGNSEFAREVPVRRNYTLKQR